MSTVAQTMKHNALHIALGALIATLAAGCPSSGPKKPDPADAESAKHTTVAAAKAGGTESEYRALALENKCPAGNDAIQGKWRFAGKSHTPDFQDELTVTGTRYVERLAGSPDGKPTAARIEGEIRCLFKNRVLVMVDKVEPEGAFDNHGGDAYPCDVLGPMDGSHDSFLFMCFFDWDVRPVKGKEFEYKRAP